MKSITTRVINKLLLQRFIIIIVFSSVCSLSWAYSFAYEDLGYNVNSDGKTVTVVTSIKTLKSVSIPTYVSYQNTLFAVTGIGNEAFLDCSSLTSISIGSRVTSIGSYAFRNCSSLTSITIPENVTSIGSYAFYGCIRLKSIEISKGVTCIESYMFSGCSNLASVNIPNTITSIGKYAFEGCSSLTSINIPEGLTSIGTYTFSGCSGLRSFTVPESLTNIGSNPFYGCYNLTTVYVNNNSIMSKSYTSSYSFKNIFGTQVTDYIIGESVTGIGNYAFSGCRSLKSVNIPDGVTSIGDYAFSGCSGLTSVTIANGVTSIGNNAFTNCLYLVYVMVERTDPTKYSCNSLAFGNTPLDEIILYVPKGCKNAYAQCTPWKQFQNIKEIGEDVLGDINADGEVDIADIVAEIDYVLSGDYSTQGDANGDGSVDVADIVYVIDYVLNHTANTPVSATQRKSVR